MTNLRKLMGGAAVLVLVALVFWWLRGTSQAELVRAALKRACPAHDTDMLTAEGKALLTNRDLSDLGEAIGIEAIQTPEDHDCQRLIVMTGTSVSLGPLLGIFDRRDQGGPGADAMIVNQLRRPYDPLGVVAGYAFSCIYIDNVQTGMNVRVIAVTRASDCRQGSPGTNPPTKPLWVEVRDRGYTANDYPLAARWDTDKQQRWNYIGLACGNKWCEIGPQGTDFSDDDQGSDYRVAIKGWYDRQRLSVATPTTPPQLSNVIGTVRPRAAAGDLDETHYNSTWLEVAAVKLAPATGVGIVTYLKLGIDGDTADVALCRGASGSCPGTSGTTSCPTSSDPWWARITVPGKSPVYRCVDREDHSNHKGKMRGTARWAWKDDDEGIWIRCAKGCCQVY